MMSPPDLERLFYEGCYDRILAKTLRTQTGNLDPFVVGALAFTGRLDEAEITGRLITSDDTRDEVDAVAVRFFLCAGACHAGLLGKALKWAKSNLAALGASDPRSRFFAYQGLGLVRYFEGRMARSRRFTLRALSAAIEAHFPYGRLLALDLRGHALVQTGQVFSGLRLLQQAGHLAADLGFVANAQTIQVSEHIYRLRYRVPSPGDLLTRLEQLARSPTVSFFARRNALLELVWQHAFRSDVRAAEQCLNEATRIALPDEDRRGRVRGLLARAVLLMLSEGRVAAVPYLEEARRLAHEDPSLRVEALFVEAAVLRAGRPEVASELEHLAHRTGIDRARIAQELALGFRSTRLPLEDRLGELLLNLPSMPPEMRVVHLVHEQLAGLVPWSLGLSPGRRIYLTETSLLTEDHGRLSVHKHPSGPSVRVLRELAAGPKTNAELMSSVWNLSLYSPSRHDPTLHTAVARLRAGLAPNGEWILTTDRGYQLASDVELVLIGNDVQVHAMGSVGEEAEPVSERESHILEILGRRRAASSTELAEDLRVSDATALRSLRSLVATGKLHRTGRGKGTRYSLIPEESPVREERS
ncbi:MAG: DeoR family transcriptional regulator [Myxococcales bacterium]|nr:DeoR family transcriptional regulator [Myxococcales bacterium]